MQLQNWTTLLWWTRMNYCSKLFLNKLKTIFEYKCVHFLKFRTYFKKCKYFLNLRTHFWKHEYFLKSQTCFEFENKIKKMGTCFEAMNTFRNSYIFLNVWTNYEKREHFLKILKKLWNVKMLLICEHIFLENNRHFLKFRTKLETTNTFWNYWTYFEFVYKILKTRTFQTKFETKMIF